MNGVIWAVILMCSLFGLESDASDATGGCDGEWYVNDSIVIDLATCFSGLNSDGDGYSYLNFTTVEGRVLAFSAQDIFQLESLIDIYNGLVVDDSQLLALKNQVPLEKSSKDLPPTIYSSGHSALVRVKRNSKSIETSNNSSLKIAKAVDCPVDLGLKSECGRIVDEVSCYCATHVQRNWTDHLSFCRENNFDLVAIESYAEEEAIVTTWDKVFWISLNDINWEFGLIWESTQKYLYPWGGGTGYANWAPGQPDNGTVVTGQQDCVIINWGPFKAWADETCSLAVYSAVCEKQP